MRPNVSRMSRAAASRIRLAVRPFRIHVDQAHLHGGERIGEVTVAAVALVGQPLALGAPVDVVVRLPDVRPSAGEPERLEAHRLQGDVAGENHQVGPGDFPAVLLLDRPEQAARLVEVHVVRPAVERREALHARTRTAATVADAVRTGAVPGHPDEQRAVMAEVRRPPVLRVRHQGMQVLDHGIQVEALELLGIVERLAHGIEQGRVLVELSQAQQVRPPVLGRHDPNRPALVRRAGHRALVIAIHVSSIPFLGLLLFCLVPGHVGLPRPNRLGANQGRDGQSLHPRPS